MKKDKSEDKTKELEELNEARKQTFEKFSKVFSFEEWDKLSGSEQEEFEKAIHLDIQFSLNAWLSTEYRFNLGDFYTLEQILDICYSKNISDYDGYGEWDFIQESTNKHFRGKTDIDFSCSFINNLIQSMAVDNLSSTDISFIVNFLKQSVELFDFKLVGIRWYNK